MVNEIYALHIVREIGSDENKEVIQKLYTAFVAFCR